MPARLVSRSEFARLAGVSRQAISKACGGPLKAACHGDRVNIDHPAAAAYLAGKGGASAGSGGATLPARAPTKATKSRPAKAATPTAPRSKSKKRNRTAPAPRPAPSVPPPPRVPAPKNITELERIQALLRPIEQEFGTSRYLRDYVLALKDSQTVTQKWLSNEEARGRLISRELVSAHVFGALGGMTRRLLRDTPKTLARRVLGLGQGATVEDAERLIREHISAQIGPVKDKVARTLRNSEEPDAQADVED